MSARGSLIPRPIRQRVVGIVVICCVALVAPGQARFNSSSEALVSALRQTGKSLFRAGKTSRGTAQHHSQHPALASLHSQHSLADASQHRSSRRALADITAAGTAIHKGQHPVRPSASSATLGAGYRPVFSNVLMRSQQELLFYVTDEAAAEEAAKQMPDLEEKLEGQFWQHTEWSQETVKVTIVPLANISQHPDTCYRWVDEPALWYSASPVDHNPFHWFMDNLIPLLVTLADNDLLDIEKMLARKALPTSEEAELMILQRRAMSLTSPYVWLLDHVTPDVLVAEQQVGSCFETLVFGVDHRARPYGRPPDNETALLRKRATALHRRFAVEAVRRTHALRHWPEPVLFPRGTGGRTRIGWVSRPQKAFNSRAVLNEDLVLQAMRERYDADISILHFRGGLEGLGTAMNLTQGLDILVGMHGAGMTNLLWMQPGAAVVQLLAYGWQSADHDYYPNAILFEQPALALGLTYMQWVNTNPQNAFFKLSDFDDKARYVEHPDESTPLPLDKWRDNGADHFWQFQDTIVDTSTFLPVMDEAMRAVAGSMRASATQPSA